MTPTLVLAAVLCGSPLTALVTSPPEAHQAEPARQPEKPEATREWLNWPLEEDPGPERGFFPLIGTVVAGSGLSAGVGYRDYGLLGSPVGFEVSALVSVRGYQLYRAHLGLLGLHRHLLDLRPPDEPVLSMMDDRRHAQRGLAVYLDGRYRHLPRNRFYGIGPGSLKDDRADFLLKGAAFDLVVQGQFTPAFGVSGRAGLLESILGDGRDGSWPAIEQRFVATEVPGLLDPPRYLVAGICAAFDTRDDLDDRRRAVFLSGAAWRFDDTGGEAFDFTRLAVDARAYVSPPALPGVIAVRAVVSTDLTGDGSRVPFFLQNALGGTDSLRAYGISRWQDRAVAHATAEYRWSPHRLLEVAPFLDVGTVGPGLSNLSGRGVNAGGGIGLRARWRNATVARMDWAVGAEGARVVLDVGSVF